MENLCQNLTMTQRNELIKLLKKIEDFFDGTLGTWKTHPLDFELKEDAKPIRLQPYTVPKLNKETFKKEVERLVLLGVLEVSNYSEWVAPSFAQHRPKSNQVPFLSYFRNLNKQLKQKTYPMPKINEMLFKLEVFSTLCHLI